LDPLFNDAGAGDYSLTTNSPAAGKGRKLSNVKADSRALLCGSTLGAFEASAKAR
jgi:hypothetical protein